MTTKQWNISNNVYNTLVKFAFAFDADHEFAFSLSRGKLEIRGKTLSRIMRLLSAAIEQTETTKFSVRIVSLKNQYCVVEVTF
jgi:hypothetical protein